MRRSFPTNEALLWGHYRLPIALRGEFPDHRKLLRKAGASDFANLFGTRGHSIPGHLNG